MDLVELKSLSIKKQLKLDQSDFGRVFSFVDFGNVDYRFDEDIYDQSGTVLPAGTKLVIDLENLAQFAHIFSEQVRFYYGHDPANKKSMGFSFIAKSHFEPYFYTKPIQKIKHYLRGDEFISATRVINEDEEGQYVYIPKCNFDVEISVDAIRLSDHFDTFCLFSSDADFVALSRYLKKKGKKFILIKGGFVQYPLARSANLVINAQDIKSYITRTKAKI